MTPRPHRMPRAWVCRARPSWCQVSPCQRAKPSSARAPTGPSHIVSQPRTWLATLTAASATTTATVAASRARLPRAIRASRRRRTTSWDRVAPPPVGDTAAEVAGRRKGSLIKSIFARPPVQDLCSRGPAAPRTSAVTEAPPGLGSSAPPLDEATDVLRLTEVLGGVVEHRHQAYCHGDGRVPAVVDDPGVCRSVELPDEL